MATATVTQTIHATINGHAVEVPAGTTILDAARKASVRIPLTLCKHPDVHATAACGICIVQMKNNGKMLRACCTPLEDNMEIATETAEIVDVRRSVLELILSKHPNECLTCGRNNDCELQTLAGDFGLRKRGCRVWCRIFQRTTRRTALCLIRGSAFRAGVVLWCARSTRMCGRCRSSIAASTRGSQRREIFRWRIHRA